MKYLNITLLSFIVILMSCNGISEEQKAKAKEFNNQVIDLTYPATDGYNRLSAYTNKIIKKVFEGKDAQSEYDNFWIEYNDILSVIKENTKTMESLVEIDEEIGLKNAGIKYLYDYQMLLENEQKELVEISQNEISPEVRYRIAELTIIMLEKALETEKFVKALQRKFAEKYSFDIPADNQNWEQVEETNRQLRKQLEQMKATL